MSLDEREDVPDAKSWRSTTATRNPRLAASSATPAPVIPAPTTTTSTPALAASSAASRPDREKGRTFRVYGRPGYRDQRCERLRGPSLSSFWSLGPPPAPAE